MTLPRPARFAAREKALGGAAGVVAPSPVVKPGDNAAGALGDTGVDGGQGSRQPSPRSGEIRFEEIDPEVARAVARTAGWVPREEWKRDPTKWSDETAFLKDLPNREARLRDRIRTVAAVAEQATAEERIRTRTEAEQAVRAAAVAKDPDAALEASRKLATVSGPPPETVAFIARHPWWNSDPIAQATAIAEIRRRNRENPNEPIKDQLEGAEAVVRKRFPEHFEQPARRQDPEEDRTDVRLSEVVRREPPLVAEGQRGGSGGNGGRRREMGWGDVPGLDRDALQPFVKKMVHRGLKEAEAQQQLAASYWDNKAKRAAAQQNG